MTSAKTLVILFRYGAGEHVNFLPALLHLCRELEAEGWQVEHLGFRSGLEPPAELSACCRVRSLPFRVNRASRPDKLWKAVLWLMLLPWIGWRLQARGVHTVFVDETLPLSAFALRLGYRGRLCFTVHDFFTDIYLTDRWWTRPIGQWLKRRDQRDWTKLDLLFTRVQAARDYLVDAGIPFGRIHVVPDSVDTGLFYPGDSDGFRKEWGIGREEIVLIHHGVMHPNKGNVRFVRAIARLKSSLPPFRLVIVGDGSEMRYLLTCIEEEGLSSRVILTGWLPGLEDIAEALRAADLGLVMRLGLPGDDFHVTSTLVHNLAAGLPVLCARLRGLEESITDQQEGLFFDPACTEELRICLETLILDADLRKRMGTAARQLAEHRFSPQAVARRYAAVLTEDSV
jgi:glycosyltransferase involved in cell wall biosynthesis